MNNAKWSKSDHPWKTDYWHVSPLNFMEEVTKEFQPPKEVKVHDVTLRDGEQQAGIIFTKDDKIRIAEKLAEIGVHRIEAGMPAVSPMDRDAIKEIVKRDLGPDIFCFSRCTMEDVKLAVDCGVKGIGIEIPASQNLIENAYKWPLERAIELSIKATTFAKEQGLYTSFFTVDATRTDLTWLLDLVERVATEGHMDSFVLVDTFGVLSPQAATYFTKKVKERISKPLETHFHSDFGMGVANTINAVLSGAEVIQTTVLGIGERTGNTPMEETVLALLAMYGIDLNLDYNKLSELSNLVQNLAGIKVPPNRPFVGNGAYTIESGMLTSWYKNTYEIDPTTVFPVHPDFVGHAKPKIAMGKKSGIDNVIMWTQELGIEVTEEEANEILDLVKSRSYDFKRVLTEEEFGEIIKNVKE